MTNLSQQSRASSSLSDPVFPDAIALMALWDLLQGTAHKGRAARAARPWLEAGQHSLGAVQAAALRGYAQHFGDHIRCQDQCPACDTRLGLDLSAVELLTAHRAAPVSKGMLRWQGWQVRYRLPVADDLAQIGADPEAARVTLINACIEDIEGPSETVPQELLAALATRMEREDPLAAAEIALECPECGNRWLSGFDACATFLARLEAWARRTLWDVHQLAMRYGWSQQDLLAMSPLRREAYLLMDAP